MRRFLTSGIKAILAIAALSTGAHWAMRIQREPSGPALPAAALPDPVTTGSLTPPRAERAAPKVSLASADPTAGLDQQHLLKLISGASDRAKVQKAVVRR